MGFWEHLTVLSDDFYYFIPGADEKVDLKSHALDPETHEFVIPQKEVKSALDVQEKWEKSEVGSVAI